MSNFLSVLVCIILRSNYNKIKLVVLCWGLKGFWKHLSGWWWCFIQFCTFSPPCFDLIIASHAAKHAGASGLSHRGPWGSPGPFQFPSISRYSSFAQTTAGDYVDEPSWYQPGLYPLRSPFPFSLLLQMSDIKEIVGPMVKNTIRRTKE